MGHRGYGYGDSFGLFMVMGLLCFALLVAVLLVTFFVLRVARRGPMSWGPGGGPGRPDRGPHGQGWHGGPGNPALAILDERLARGEVDVESYRAARAERG